MLNKIRVETNCMLVASINVIFRVPLPRFSLIGGDSLLGRVKPNDVTPPALHAINPSIPHSELQYGKLCARWVTNRETIWRRGRIQDAWAWANYLTHHPPSLSLPVKQFDQVQFEFLLILQNTE